MGQGRKALNASRPMEVIPSGIIISFSEVQPLKVSSPISEILPWITIDFKFLQSMKACSFKTDRLGGSVISSSLLSLKAAYCMLVTLDGIVNRSDPIFQMPHGRSFLHYPEYVLLSNSRFHKTQNIRYSLQSTV